MEAVNRSVKMMRDMKVTHLYKKVTNLNIKRLGTVSVL